MSLTKFDFQIKYRLEKFNLANEFFRRSDYEDQANDEIYLSTFENKLKNIIIVVIEIIAILTRNARRTLKSHRENNLDVTQSQKTEKNQIELLDNNASSSNEFEKKNTTII